MALGMFLRGAENVRLTLGSQRAISERHSLGPVQHPGGPGCRSEGAWRQRGTAAPGLGSAAGAVLWPSACCRPLPGAGTSSCSPGGCVDSARRGRSRSQGFCSLCLSLSPCGSSWPGSGVPRHWPRSTHQPQGMRPLNGQLGVFASAPPTGLVMGEPGLGHRGRRFSESCQEP